MGAWIGKQPNDTLYQKPSSFACHMACRSLLLFPQQLCC